MHRSFLVLALMFSALPCSAMAQSKDALIGTWKLASATDTTENGEKNSAFGSNPVGFLTYTADGRMMAMISQGGRKPLSVNDWIAAPAGERAEAFATFIGYAGTYTLGKDHVIHHVQIASLQNLVATDQVRTLVKLEGDLLVLRTPSFLKAGRMVTTELTWKRLKGEAAAP